MFQKTVINKYLKTQNPKKIQEKWDLFCLHFHNTIIQENIRNSKEEQYQGEFLLDLFVQVLGYTKNPTPNFNLTTEYKNVKDSKKADGAIIIQDKVVAIIELKGTNTTDLSKIETQAFGYKNNQPDCKYVITSNFEKLRFYVDNAIEHLEFNLFELTKEKFDLLYLCLAFENISTDVPAKIKYESLSREDEITKKLYKDYSVFKRELFQNLTEKNPQFNPLELFKKSQKLLDRLLFLFFGEDRGLLPVNFTRGILNDWQKLKELDAYIPLYERFKQNFGYIDKGGKKDVFAYNGGLFKPDEILDNVTIDDQLLYNHTYKIADYDFASEVDVNILGHIFENSLSEIEEIQAELSASERLTKNSSESFPKDSSNGLSNGSLESLSNGSLESLSSESSESLSNESSGSLSNGSRPIGIGKRKKDGIFYTPKYITKYIVKNTVGKLCDEKKTEYEIVEEDYFTDKKRQQKTKLALLKRLSDYRTWLHQLTIVDPACGSGAFLNEALNFLIDEHQYIDELEAKLTGSSIAFAYHSDSILENNLFGVDLNEESVEIAKLSLWLRTAEPNRKLNDLNNNIKCGNSLIDDPDIAGEKAFSWEKEFPRVFKEKKAYHLVFTTHNSRTSQRMKSLGIVPGKPAELNLSQEIQLAQIFSDIVKHYQLEVVSFAVCKDHVHLLLVCTEDELYNQVRLMKSISSKNLNLWMTSSPMDLDPLSDEKARHQDALEDADAYQPLEHQNHLWSQKFFSVDTESWKWMFEQEKGFPYEVTYFDRVMHYIKENRTKHGLPQSEELERIISGFTISPEEAFAKQYKGGFDVVIGNPPYVNIKTLPRIHEFLKKKYNEIHTGYNDLMYYFLYNGINLLSSNGIFGVITSNYFLQNDYAEKLRVFLNKKIEIIINFNKYLVFEDASVHSTIVIAKKESLLDDVSFYTYNTTDKLNEINLNKNYLFTKINRFELSNKWIITNNLNQKIIDKLNKNSVELGSLFEIAKGSESGKNEIFTIDSETVNKFNIEAEILKKCIKNSDINRYEIKFENLYLIYTDNEFIGTKFPNAFSYLEKYKDLLLDRRGPKTNEYPWWRLHRPSIKHFFEAKQKIVVPYRANKNRFAIDDSQYYNNGGDIRILVAKEEITLNIKYVLTLLNSNLLDWLYGFIGKKKGDSREYFNKPLFQLPIKEIPLEHQQPFIEKADQMMELSKGLQSLAQKFQRTLQRELFENSENVPKKLEQWYLLTYADFLKEIDKIKGLKPLGLSQKSEWEDYFLAEQQKAIAIKSKLDKTDKEIDQMVYKLYGLNDEEISLVEQNS